MIPTLYEGDYLGVDQSAYSNRTPTHGDLIVFKKKNQPDLIKRIIALPGETIEVQDGKVLINGIAIAEPYVENEPNYSMAPVTIGADQVFVLGDNRPNSSDSHIWGAIHISDIIGQVVVIRSSAK